MSGFFMMRRDAFEPLAPSLFSQGFKILLDIVVTAHGRLRIVEEPYVFRLPRASMGNQIGRQRGARFSRAAAGEADGRHYHAAFSFFFALVGSIGLVVVHLARDESGACGFGVAVLVGVYFGGVRGDDGEFSVEQSSHLSR